MLRPLRAGDTLANRYELTKLLGEGGMGKVFAADDKKLSGKRWAIKEISDASEADKLMRLQHRNLPAVIDYYYFASISKGYIVMELVEGLNLQQLFEKQSKNIDFSQLVSYAKQLCDVLSYLHAHKPHPIIYRDLKPSNVMIEHSGQAKLIDFGISRAHKPFQAADTVHMGSLGFAAPEQLRNGQTDQRTDLYQLGAMLFYLLSGGTYYSLDTIVSSSMRRDMPEKLLAIVSRLLEHVPDHRYQTAEEVRSALDDVSLVKVSSCEASPVTGEQGMKIVLVGGLYTGAGSTFMCFELARILSKSEVSCSVVEYPAHDGEHYYLLEGQEVKPESYIYLTERLEWTDYSSNHSKLKEWKTGNVTWYPLHPYEPYRPWPLEFMLKTIYAAKKPIVIVDVSASWTDPAVKELCAGADDILVVFDAQIHKFYRRDTLEKLRFFKELSDAGRKIRGVANRWSKQIWKTRIDELPFQSYIHVPVKLSDEQIDNALEPVLSGWIVNKPKKNRKRQLLKFK